VFNAANEAAVAIFLEGRMRFGAIPEAIDAALTAHANLPSHDKAALLAADAAARATVTHFVESR
jgi:1-deoxy-D-xylulose-5-phosphate reductoisomerase